MSCQFSRSDVLTYYSYGASERIPGPRDRWDLMELAGPLQRAIERAVKGVDKEDAVELGSLGALVIGLGTSTDDGRLIMAGMTVAWVQQMLQGATALKGVSPPLREALERAKKGVADGLRRLGEALTAKTLDSTKLMDALAALTATVWPIGVRLQVAAQAAQSAMGPLAGGPSE